MSERERIIVSILSISFHRVKSFQDFVANKAVEDRGGGGRGGGVGRRRRRRRRRRWRRRWWRILCVSE